MRELRGLDTLLREVTVKIILFLARKAPVLQGKNLLTFFFFLQRNTFRGFLFFCFSVHQAPSKKGSTLKRKNLLLR